MIEMVSLDEAMKEQQKKSKEFEEAMHQILDIESKVIGVSKENIIKQCEIYVKEANALNDEDLFDEIKFIIEYFNKQELVILYGFVKGFKDGILPNPNF